jgi:hypothetical protein
MKMGIFAIFMTFIFIYISMNQTDNHVTDEAFLRLKNAADFGTHDAAEEIDQLERESGNIVFLQPQALSSFKTALMNNLKVNSGMYPISPNLFRSSDQVKILVFDYIDKNSTICTSFPCTYVNSTYGYIDTLKGPSIVAIISMRHPRPYGISIDGSFIVGSSHEYIP